MKSLNLTSWIIVAIFSVSSLPAAFAAPNILDGVAIDIRGGTLGGGAEINYAINSKFTVGLGFNRFTYDTTQTVDDIDYNTELKLQTISLLASFHPFDGVFRLTGGIMNNGNQLSLTASPNLEYTIGDKTYTAAQVGTLDASIKFNTLAPYFGLGWGLSADTGFGVTLDIGILFQGAPKVEMKANGLIADNSDFLADLQREETKAEDDISAFTMYPVVALGLEYRF